MKHVGHILFIGHEASLTGAPRSLLRIIQLLKKELACQPLIVLGKGGDMKSEYAAQGRVIVLESPAPRLFWRVLQKLFPRLVLPNANKRRLLADTKHRPPELIFVNTLSNGLILKHLDHLTAPVICRVAEFSVNFRSYPLIEYQKQRIHRYIAVSEAVKADLIANGFPSDRIDVVYGAIDDAEPPKSEDFSLRQMYNLPPDTLLVGACGTRQWRKGTDLFIQVAHYVVNRLDCKNICFFWQGGRNSGYTGYDTYRYDIERYGLDGHVFLLETTRTPVAFYSQLDLFLLTSREDPFPLVVLEAAQARIPVIGFEHSGGAPEFIGNDCGCVVPYADIAAMAEVVESLANSPDKRKHLGQNALNKVRAHFTIEKAGERILQIVEKTLTAKNADSDISY